MKKTIKIISFVLLFVLLAGTCSALFFLNKTEEKTDNGIPDSHYRIYGVANVGQSNPYLRRLEDSTKYSYFTTRDGYVFSSFDNAYPFSDIKEITDDYGNEFVKIPKFYTSIKTHEDGTFDLLISGFKYDGFTTLFTDDDGNEIEYVLIGKYEGAKYINDSGVTRVVSKRDLAPETFISFTDSRLLCQANGIGYCQYNYRIYNIVQQLFLIEFATTNSQAVFNGVVAKDTFVKTGTGSPEFNEELQSSFVGYLNRTNGSFNYRGMENLWGNVYTWVDGVSMDSSNSSISYFGEKFDKTLFSVENTVCSNGFIKNLSPIEGTAFLGFPSAVCSDWSGTESFCDMYYYQEQTVSTLYLTTGGSYSATSLVSGLWRMVWMEGHYSITDYNRPSAGCRLCYMPTMVI